MSEATDQLALVRSLRLQNETLADENARLKTGGGGGTLGDVTVPIKEYVDARDDAVESRLSAKLDGLPTKLTVWGAAGSLFLGILAVLAFAGDRFDAGLGSADTRQEQLQRDQRQDAAVNGINAKLDLLIAAQERAPVPPVSQVPTPSVVPKP